MVLLLAMILAAPLPYGGVLPTGILLVEAGAFLVALLTLTSRSTGSIGAGWIPVAIAGLLVLFGVVQLAPIPENLLRSLSPVSAEIYHETNAILGTYGRDPIAPRISIAPAETASVVLLTAAFAALFASAAALMARRTMRRLLAWTLVLGAIALIVIWAPMRSEQTAGRLSGPFVNPNHLAGFLEIALAVCFGLFWAELMIGGETAARKRERAARIETRLLRLAIPLLPLLAIAGGLMLTRSRGGIAAAAITLLFGVLAASTHPSVRRRWKRVATALAILTVSIGGFLSISTGTWPLLRFLTFDPRDPDSDLRPRLWSLSIDAWRQFPIFGSGLGTFREAFRPVQPRDVRGLAEQAHSEPLQMLVTGGVVGMILTLLLVGSLWWLLFRGWRTQKHREESAMTLAALMALTSLLLHGFVEFNFSIPAIPAVLAIILGWGWAAARDRMGPRAV